MAQNPIESFIVAVRRRALSDETYVGASTKKAGYLAGFITKRLENKSREMRMAVIQAITGLPVTSYKQLTNKYIDILIEEVEHNESIIRIIETDCQRLLESGSYGEPPRDLYPWDRPTFDLPVL